MALNPLDIQQKTFRVAIRGYAEDEVDDFLDEVVMAIREYEQKLADTNDEVEGLRARLEENREVEDALRKTFVAAQRTADQIAEEARRDSERLLSDARADASRLTMEHGIEKNRLIEELARLREIVTDVKARLADIASDVNTRIDSVASDIDDAQVTYGRWEDSYAAPPQSAISELREVEEVDDDEYQADGEAAATDEVDWDTDGEDAEPDSLHPVGRRGPPRHGETPDPVNIRDDRGDETDRGETDRGETDSAGTDSGETDSAGTDSAGTDSAGTDSADAHSTDAHSAGTNADPPDGDTDDDREIVDGEVVDGDMDEADARGGYVDQSSTSSARRPWERFDR